MSEASGDVVVRSAEEAGSARLLVFCSPGVREVFDPVVAPTQIWQADPYDVGEIHADARVVFADLLRRATAKPLPDRGRLLLLRGVAGSGKTHLMRAFRSMTHQDGKAHFAYLQLTTAADNYDKYVLSNVVTSLAYPYAPPDRTATGLALLSAAVLDAVPGVTDAMRTTIRDGERAEAEAAIFDAAGRLVSEPQFDGIDEDVVRCLLFLQRDERGVPQKVGKWLRGEEMNDYDRAFIGRLVPRPKNEQAMGIVVALGRLMFRVQGAALVLCVDQLEDVFNQSTPGERFRLIVDTLIALAEQLPTAVAVISCLSDYYEANRPALPMSRTQRLEIHPPPVFLTANRSLDEVRSMVARRLGFLYAEAGLPVQAGDLFPFRADDLKPLANLNTRSVLAECLKHHTACVAARGWMEPAWRAASATATATATAKASVAPLAPPPASVDLDQAWNDATSRPTAVPDDEAGLATLVAATVDRCNAEVPPPYRLVARRKDNQVEVEEHGTEPQPRRTLVGVCEKRSNGGGLWNQVGKVAKAAGGRRVVLVRSSAFPANRSTQVYKQIESVTAGTPGNRAVVVSDADWRSMAAFAAFAGAHAGRPGFADWQRAARPLSQLHAVELILDLRPLAEKRVASAVEAPPAPGPSPVPDARPTPAAAKPQPAKPQPAKADAAATPAAGPLSLGKTRGLLTPAAVTLAPEDLKQHMAFIGGSGSGKTTAALRVIEQLLMRGVPAVLVDRKGDLARYADPAAYDVPADPARPDLPAALHRFRDRVDVALYTPGSGGHGRPLTLPVMPAGAAELPPEDRRELAKFAADALAGMIGLNVKAQADKAMTAILSRAIEVVSASGQPVTVDVLAELIGNQDESLTQAVGGGFDGKLYKKLAQSLATLLIQHDALLAAAGGERLDVDDLLGRGGSAGPGRTRLAIVNTQFLTSDAAAEFWVSQFLMALYRWQSKHPSPTLQAVVMLDEADRYLPANRQPATKAPLESLLKRARSAGLGLMLATQSPGDLDYKCRDNVRSWLVGRVKEQTAVAKLRPMFAGGAGDVAGKLPTQGTGEFFLLSDGRVTALRSGRSLMATQQVAEDEILALAAATRRL